MVKTHILGGDDMSHQEVVSLNKMVKRMTKQEMTIRGFWFIPINDGHGKEQCPKYEKRCSRDCKNCTQGDALIEVEKNKKLASDLLKRNEELIKKFNLR